MNDLLALGPGLLLYTAGIPLALFLGYYLTWSRWWTTVVGRILVALAASLVAVILISITKNIFGEWPGIDMVRFGVYAAMNLSFWSLFFTLRAIQKSTTKHLLKARPEREKEKA